MLGNLFRRARFAPLAWVSDVFRRRCAPRSGVRRFSAEVFVSLWCWAVSGGKCLVARVCGGFPQTCSARSGFGAVHRQDFLLARVWTSHGGDLLLVQVGGGFPVKICFSLRFGPAHNVPRARPPTRPGEGGGHSNPPKRAT